MIYFLKLLVTELGFVILIGLMYFLLLWGFTLLIEFLEKVHKRFKKRFPDNR